MRRRALLLLSVAALLVAGASVASAGPGPVSGPTSFLAPLSGAQEVPQVVPEASGMAEFTLEGDALHYRVTVRHLGSTAILAHIHAPAPRGVNAGVFVTLCGVPIQNPASPPPACAPITDGQLVEGTVTPETFSSNPVEGEARFEALLDHIRSGNAYVNVHTVNNPPGETRGQILVTGG